MMEKPEIKKNIGSYRQLKDLPDDKLRKFDFDNAKDWNEKVKVGKRKKVLKEITIENSKAKEAAVGEKLRELIAENGEISITRLKQKVDALLLYLKSENRGDVEYAITELYKLAQFFHDRGEVIFEIIDALAYGITTSKAHNALDALNILLENKEIEKYVKQYIIERMVFYNEGIPQEEMEFVKNILSKACEITTDLRVRRKVQEILKKQRT